MKTLKKGKKFKKVAPLPKGWLSSKQVNAEAKTNGVYRSSFIQLKKLLDDGWKFSPHEPRRKAEKLVEKKNNKK